MIHRACRADDVNMHMHVHIVRAMANKRQTSARPASCAGAPGRLLRAQRAGASERVAVIARTRRVARPEENFASPPFDFHDADHVSPGRMPA
ncbi:hypothetical protein WS68_03995 [Burkholderia sp. TSV86]|nr:hypothetical protein WS68_03995 [Burkholderia sp. TSV86]